MGWGLVGGSGTGDGPKPAPPLPLNGQLPQPDRRVPSAILTLERRTKRRDHTALILEENFIEKNPTHENKIRKIANRQS
jgi:hypothetical protein